MRLICSLVVTVGWKRLKQVNACTAMVLPPVVAGIIALLFVLYGIEWEGGRKLPHGWSSYVPKSPTTALIMVFMLAGTAFVTFQGARKYPTLANGSTTAGIATTATLSWATPLCNWTGGTAAGVTVAGTIVAIAIVVRALKTGSIKWNITILRPVKETQEGMKGILSVMQIGMALYMGTIVLIALFYEYISPSARPLLLVFAGVGMMAAATVSSESNLKNYMAIAGMVISLIGSYMQIDQAIAAADENSIRASSIMFTAVVLAFVPFTILASPKHQAVRALTVPLLSAVIVSLMVILVMTLPAVFLSQGCSQGGSLFVLALPVIGIIAFTAGVAVFFVVLLTLILGKRNLQNTVSEDV